MTTPTFKSRRVRSPEDEARKLFSDKRWRTVGDVSRDMGIPEAKARALLRGMRMKGALMTEYAHRETIWRAAV